MTTTPYRFASFALFCAVLCSALPLGANERPAQITVTLRSGRTFEASIDQRTDERHLWLHFGTGSVRVLRPVEWSRVAQVQLDGERLSANELQDQLEHLIKAELPLRQVPPIAPVAPSGLSDAELAKAALGSTHRIRSVSFDVALRNWDPDVAADGLSIRVFPTDGSGRLVPVAGTLTVELYALRSHDFNAAVHGRGQVTQRVGRWSARVTADAIGSEQPFHFPFRAANPELDTDWSPYGLVHVKLVVPGHGVFEDSLDGVRIRQFAPLRDHRELRGNSR